MTHKKVAPTTFPAPAFNKFFMFAYLTKHNTINNSGNETSIPILEADIQTGLKSAFEEQETCTRFLAAIFLCVQIPLQYSFVILTAILHKKFLSTY